MTKPKIVLCGEAYGENEAKINAPFVGASGIELLRMLDEAGVLTLTSADYDYINKYYREGSPLFIDMIWRLHPELRRTNVFMQHPPGNRLEWFCGPRAEGIRGYPALIKGKASGYVRAEFIPELERLGDELVDINPNLVICMGNTALWALAGTTGVAKLRGTTCTSTHTAVGFKCLAAYHPAAVLRQWENRPVTVLDLMKARREAEYPEIRRPRREIWIEPSLEDIRRFINDHIRNTTQLLSVDIETSGNRITCIGLSPRPDLAIVIPFDDKRRKGGNYWPTKDDEQQCWQLIREVLSDRSIPKLFQNGMFDIAFIWRSTGIKVLGASEDTMLAHHALQPEALKGLAFLGSVYTDEGAWKSQRKSETIKPDA